MQNKEEDLISQRFLAGDHRWVDILVSSNSSNNSNNSKRGTLANSSNSNSNKRGMRILLCLN